MLMDHARRALSVFLTDELLGKQNETSAGDVLGFPESKDFYTLLDNAVHSSVSTYPNSPISTQFQSLLSEGSNPDALLDCVSAARTLFTRRSKSFRTALLLLRTLLLLIKSHETGLKTGLTHLLGAALNQTILGDEVKRLVYRVRYIRCPLEPCRFV